jgi:copper transport protein
MIRRFGTLLRLAAVVALSGMIAPRTASAHAALLGSSPKNGSVLSSPPPEVRLLFSEEIVPELCHVEISGVESASRMLGVRRDSHDARRIIVPLSPLSAGAYTVTWRVVSADGHTVSGSLKFTITGAAQPVTASSTPSEAAIAAHNDSAQEKLASANRFPYVSALLRGIGGAALAALVGLLLFAVTSRPGVLVNPTRPLNALALTACVALAFHVFAWGNYVAPGAIHAVAWRTILLSNPGKLESVRVILAILALISLALFRRRGVALLFSGAALLTGAAIGHAGAFSPLLAVPLLMIHLIAVAAWLGGLAWLIISWAGGPANMREQAYRVSRTAMAAALAVGVTGILESILLLTSFNDLFYSAYGRLLLLKVAGWLTLLSFGWYHRYRALPTITTNEESDIRASLRSEISVMVVVILVAGFLSYTPLPKELMP